MMAKRPDLSTSLRNAAGSRPAPAAPPAAGEAPSRVGTVSLTVHVPRMVRDQLKRLALDHGTTMHAICGEAFNMLFASYGQPEVAPMTPKRRE